MCMFILWILLSLANAIPCPQHAFYLIGSYKAQCTEDGAWEPKQCWASTGACWCVDSDGERISDDAGPGVALDCSTVATDVRN